MSNSLKQSLSLKSCAIVLAMVATPAQAETLFEAMSEAYSNNPTLAAQRAQQKALDEGVAQAVSGWRPTVSLSGEAGLQRQDINNTGANNEKPISGQFSVRQPLYRGGRTVAATDSAEANVKAGLANLLSTEQQILLQSITAYMDVLRDQAVVELNRSNEQVLRRQLEATQDRFSVGEITKTDVAQAEARLSRAKSDRTEAKGSLESSRATYARIVGRRPGDLVPPPPLPPLPQSEDEALSAGLQENPTLVAAQYYEEAARADVRNSSGQLLPTISLTASHTQAKNTSSIINDSATSDISAAVSVPLYQSGSVYSLIRQAKQVSNQRRIQIEEARRNVVESVTQAWENMNTARARIASTREQVRANEIALDGVIQEAAVGARTTLDVLNAEQELFDARVALVRAERDEYVSAFSLQSSIGRLTAKHLNLKVDIYDPSLHYRKVRDKWIGRDVE